MNYHNITHNDMLNGDGLRVVLWVSGCSHNCPGCQNPQTHNPDSGIKFDENAKEELFHELEKDYISGITFSGGDPLFVKNRETIKNLILEIREKFPTKTIWVYTGYKYEDLCLFDQPHIATILNNIDVLVEGPFIKDLKDINYPWAGSTNQRVIRFNET